MEIITGKVTAVPFVTKSGRKIKGAESLFLEINNQRYFIKIQAGQVSRMELEKWLDQSITVKVLRATGAWDSDDPNVQSRIGDYVAILEVLT